MDLFVSVFFLTMDDVLSVEGVVVLKGIVGSKAVSIDSQRFLLVGFKQDRFVGGFRWDHVLVIGASINEDEHRRFVTLIGTTSTS